MSELLEQEIRTLQSLLWSERDPEGRAFAPLADAFLRAGETRQALDLLTDGMARLPDFASGHVVAARLYFEKGMLTEADLASRRVLELDSDNVLALETLASVLEQNGSDDEAREVRATLAELDPEVDGVSPGAEAPTAGVAFEHAPTVRMDYVPPDSEPDLESVIDPELAAFSLDLVDEDAPVLEDAPVQEEAEEAAEAGLRDPIDGSGMDVRASVAELDDDAPDPELMAFSLETTDSDPELDEAVDASAPATESELEMSLDALAPDPEPEAEVSLDALAPDPEPEAEMSLDALAPDPEPEAEVSLDALAPDPEPEAEMSLDALAPDPEPEAEVSLDALAPDPEPELEMSLDALAPDAEPELEMSLDALAPDPEPEPDFMSLDALAPDPEVMSLDALAPEPEFMSLDALAPEPEFMSLDALAPDPDVEMSLDALAPDPEPGFMSLDALTPDPDVEMSLDALAPDPEPEFMSLDALAPDVDDSAADEEPETDVEPAVASLADLAPDASPAGDRAPNEPEEPAAPVRTRTLAELYVRQGFIGKALDVLRHLQDERPDDESLATRITELESGGPQVAVGPPPMVGGVTSRFEPLPLPDADRDEEVEAQARALAEGGHGHDAHEVDTPFAWAESERDEPTGPAEGPGIGDYFDGLLGWHREDS